jgi:hypothetical protein
MPQCINRCLRKILRSPGPTISLKINCGDIREINGSANQTAQMEDRTYTESLWAIIFPTK